MRLATNRPGPVDYVHSSGEQATIDFFWGEASNAAPIGIVILLQGRDKPIKLGEEIGTWSTFGEARRRGIELAIRWIQRDS